MPQKPTEIVKAFRTVVKQDGAIYHLLITDPLTKEISFTASRAKPKVGPKDVHAKCLYQQANALVWIAQGKVTVPMAKKMNEILKKGGSKLTFAVGGNAPPELAESDAADAKAKRESPYDEVQYQADADGYFPEGSNEAKVMDTLAALWAKNGKLPKPVGKAHFDKVQNLMVQNPPKTKEAAKALNVIKQQMALVLQRDKRVSDAAKADAKAKLRLRLQADWDAIRPHFKPLIQNIAIHLKKDLKSMAADYKTIPALLHPETGDVDKVRGSITFYINMQTALEQKGVDWKVEPSSAPLS